jgi:hypothetical protein
MQSPVRSAAIRSPGKLLEGEPKLAGRNITLTSISTLGTRHASDTNT